MCDDCREMATDYIFDMVNMGYTLKASIRLVRDMVVSRGLLDRINTSTIEDVQKLHDLVTEAGEALTEMYQTSPGVFAVLAYAREAERAEQETD